LTGSRRSPLVPAAAAVTTVGPPRSIGPRGSRRLTAATSRSRSVVPRTCPSGTVAAARRASITRAVAAGRACARPSTPCFASAGRPA